MLENYSFGVKQQSLSYILFLPVVWSLNRHLRYSSLLGVIKCCTIFRQSDFFVCCVFVQGKSHFCYRNIIISLAMIGMFYFKISLGMTGMFYKISLGMTSMFYKISLGMTGMFLLKFHWDSLG
jgi:hypothetical protein